jgi:two-component system chemotaxis sensor kinase CheA
MDNKEIINDLFRDFHTIKGECGFLKLIKLGEVTHNLENLLDLLRYDEIDCSTEIIDILLCGVDIVFNMLKSLDDENLDSYNKTETNELIELINKVSERGRTHIGEILEETAELKKKDISNIINKQKENGFVKKFGEIAVDNKYITKEQLEESLKNQRENKEKSVIKTVKNDPIIKVKASQINYLVDMIGELLIAENQLEDENIIQLKKITKQIQNAAMMLRTVKVKNLFINMKRVVRDLAKKLDKQIDFKIIGEDLEIDRNLVEALEEPLIHILRNALGHGIEYRDERKKNEKNETGEIILKAERQGNNIVISIRDDGRGLNKDKILKKAISLSLVNEESAKQLKESEIFGFIFNTGFSTADNVDNVSGRGVGMDIVKSTVSKLRGKIEIYSDVNSFTEINLIFPLSMAIIDGMIVTVGNSFLVIPVSNIIESLSLEEKMIHTVKNKVKVIDLRGEIIPVIELVEYFKLSTAERSNINYTVAVIVESSNRKFALIVDEIIAKKEIVIKSLGEKFKNLCGISSGTVLTGGKIGLVVNIDEVVDINRVSVDEIVVAQ